MNLTPTALRLAPRAEPFRYTSPERERVRYDVTIYPPNGQEWSFSQLYAGTNFKGGVVSEAESTAFRKRLGEVLATHNVRKAYGPTVSYMSGTIICESRFTTEVPLSCGVILMRPSVPCDGGPLPRHTAFTMSPAGCLLLVYTGQGSHGPVCICAHAGRNCLIDMSHVLTGKQTRSDASVVNAVVRLGRRLGLKPQDALLRTFGGVPWEAFPHTPKDPRYRDTNKLLLAHLHRQYDGTMIRKREEDGAECLCTHSLVKRQAELERIGDIKNVWELPLYGAFAHENHTNPAFTKETRNLVIVVCR